MDDNKKVQTPAVYNEGNTEAEDRYHKYFDLFREFETIRNQSVRFLSKNGIQRNIVEYVRDSVDRMNEYKLKPDYKEDWQNNVFDPVTRDKTIFILSQLASTRMKPEILAKTNSIFTTKDTETRRQIFSDFLEAANIHNCDKDALIWELYTALSEGTVFGFESWMKGNREVEFVEKYDPDTGVMETKKISINDWDDVYGELIPLEEIYPETIWTHRWDQIKRVFWAREMKESQFKQIFGKFSNASQVKPVSGYISETTVNWGIPADIDPQNIWVLMYFDESADKYCVYANGTEISYGPMPWNHKKKPIWMGIGEPIHKQFLYGKSLPDKLMGMQDVDNGMLNAMLDQLILSLNSPLMVDAEVDLSDGYLEPGRMITVPQGTKAERLSLGAVDPAAQFIWGQIKRSMEETSVSAQAQGVASGGRKTKYEVQQLQEGALQLAGLFLQMMESAMAQKYSLRLKNIIQYYSQPRTDKDKKLKFKFIVLEDRKLTNGRQGKRMLEIVDNVADLPTKDRLQEIAEEESGQPFDVMTSTVEPIVVTREWFTSEDWNYDVVIVPNSSVKSSEIQKRNQDIAFYQATANNPLFDQVQNAKDFAKAFGKPISMVKEQPEAMPGEIPGLPGIPGMKGSPAPEVQPNMEQL